MLDPDCVHHRIALQTVQLSAHSTNHTAGAVHNVQGGLCQHFLVIPDPIFLVGPSDDRLGRTVGIESIHHAIERGLGKLGSKLEPLTGLNDEEIPDINEWIAVLRHNWTTLHPLAVLGQYRYRPSPHSQLTSRYIVTVDGNFGLVQYLADAEIASQLSNDLDLDEISDRLAERTHLSLETGEKINDVYAAHSEVQEGVGADWVVDWDD
ncbi:hypothetical protein HDU87_007867 [Geranomyces variabilis]|uniref:Uncharacterized protein n=1 Tax=Geranomyces variabilis TaxID=109894 RepID=A0AAD5TDS8_9FUNG|nr:hypothetical protein HDU87_007867 [Geranomyces variabilis]